MNRTAQLVSAAALVAFVAFAPAAFAAPQDPVACEQANAAVLIKAVAVVQAAENLDASDTTINDALIANVKSAGEKVDDAVAALDALPADAPAAVRAPLQAALAAAQAELQQATKLLDDAASSPDLSDVLVKAKAALGAAIDVQVKVCAEAPAPTATPAPTASPAPVADPPSQVTAVPRGAVETGGGPVA